MNIKSEVTVLASLILVLACSLETTSSMPFKMVWLKIKSDSRLGTTFDLTQFPARKGDTLDSILHENFGTLKPTELAGKDLHLYRMIPVDLSKKIEDLELNLDEERLFLTGEDLEVY